MSHRNELSLSDTTPVDLQMFELAEKYVKQSDPGFEIVGNYMSPCSDAYQKASLAPAHHRIQSTLNMLDWGAERRFPAHGLQ